MPHDVSVPYTEEQIENIQARFRTLPTYDRDERDEYILKSDVKELAKVVDYDRTPEAFAIFENYLDSCFGGKLYLKFCLEGCRDSHDTVKLAAFQAREFDTDGDGFISEDEFQCIIQVLYAHDAKLSKTTFEEFVAQADSNRDGKVSIEECSDWVKSHLTSS